MTETLPSLYVFAFIGIEHKKGEGVCQPTETLDRTEDNPGDRVLLPGRRRYPGGATLCRVAIPR